MAEMMLIGHDLCEKWREKDLVKECFSENSGQVYNGCCYILPEASPQAVKDSRPGTEEITLNAGCCGRGRRRLAPKGRHQIAGEGALRLRQNRRKAGGRLGLAGHREG